MTAPRATLGRVAIFDFAFDFKFEFEPKSQTRRAKEIMTPCAFEKIDDAVYVYIEVKRVSTLQFSVLIKGDDGSNGVDLEIETLAFEIAECGL